MSIPQYIKNISLDVFGKTNDHNKIDLWKVNIGDIEGDMQSIPEILSDDEVDRASKYRLNSDKVNFIISRTILKIILSSYLEKHPKDIVFSYTNTLKPVLNMQGRNRICFNVSHSNGLILYAVSRGDEVGIDVEYIPSILNCDMLVKSFFSSGEREYLSLVPQEKRQKEFTKIWVTKEAYLKATAKGMSGIKGVEVIIKKNKPSMLECGGGGGSSDKWKIHQFEPEKGYVASIVYK
ncbi:MAG: 4'-phosphopantetheinyl transferase superfamily protein [Candidatus Gracilibacteria bacterium]